MYPGGGANALPPAFLPLALGGALSGRVIITGGAGFIGSHLAQRLADAGEDLLLVDNLSTGRRANIAHLLGPRCELLEADAGEALADSAVTRGASAIYHLAAAVGVQLVVDDPAGMIHTNVDVTRVVLQAAVREGADVLITSSSEVYGKCPVLPLREDMELVYGPTTASRWAYGMTKALDEHLALDFARRDGLRAIVVRLFNTIGPRQVGHYGMVVPRFVAKAVAGTDLQIYGDGQQTRAFCDVRDVVRAMTELIFTTSAAPGVYNIGSSRSLTIDALADLVIGRSGSSSRKHYVPYAEVFGKDFEDPPHRLPEVTKLTQAIGWEPQVSLEQTLDELIALERGDEASAHPAGAEARSS